MCYLIYSRKNDASYFKLQTRAYRSTVGYNHFFVGFGILCQNFYLNSGNWRHVSCKISLFCLKKLLLEFGKHLNSSSIPSIPPTLSNMNITIFPYLQYFQKHTTNYKMVEVNNNRPEITNIPFFLQGGNFNLHLLFPGKFDVGWSSYVLLECRYQ